MSMREPESNLGRTPALERLLQRLALRLSAQVWMFGLGTLLALTCAWLAFAFFADFGLRVPHGVRVAHGLVALALPGFCAWRYLIRPLARRPDRAQTAVLLERQRPGSNDLFVSAVQLQRNAGGDAAPTLVDAVLASAEREALQTRIDGVLDERPARWRAALGVGSTAVLALAWVGYPDLARTFFARMLDSSAHWPQRTHLTLQIPLPPEKASVVERDGVLFVRVARGSDVPVLVRAEGARPDDVLLDVSGSSPIALSASSDGTYRTLLRSLQNGVELRASGGDDEGLSARATIEVLSPPDLAELALRIEPPAYTGRAPSIEFNRDVEVLAGSRLQVVIRTDPPEALARARILPMDRVQELTPMDFPAREANVPPLPGRGFEWLATESLRLRFELEDAQGLTNPDPGLFAVRVQTDERPQISIFAPARVEVDTLLGGWIALRARASDEYGIARMTWSSRPSGEGAVAKISPLEWRIVAPEERTPDETRPVVAIAGVRIDVAALGDAEHAVLEGSQFILEVQAADNRPEAGDESISQSASVAVRVLSSEEFLRRTQDRLARVRLSVGELETLARDKGRRARELVASLESDAPESAGTAGELAALYAGARRVEGDAHSIARELCSIAESVLYARLDSEADGTLIALDEALAAAPRSGSLPVEAWRKFGSSAEVGRGRATLAGQLAGLVDLALKIDFDDARAASRAAERALQSTDLAEVHAALGEHLVLHKELDQHIQALLARLAEWDNFQSILSLTKDILNRQKALRERAKAALGGK